MAETVTIAFLVMDLAKFSNDKDTNDLFSPITSKESLSMLNDLTF